MLKEAGATVTVLGRTSASLKAAVASGAATGWVEADVTDPGRLGAAIAEAVAARGEIDILINNAGAAESASFVKSEPALFERMMALNLMGAVHAMRPVLPGMAKRGHGRVINIASTAGLKGYAYVSAYAAAKHALVGLTRSVALEVAAQGITVNALCPGYAETDLLRESLARIVARTGRSEAEARAELLRGNPQGRFIQPEEVAAAALFLCRPEASAITGQAIAITGGEF
jgi:NAD(P)-dependent dehydrogenase (short-subunit alcohol dehydrogenase family)